MLPKSTALLSPELTEKETNAANQPGDGKPGYKKEETGPGVEEESHLHHAFRAAVMKFLQETCNGDQEPDAIEHRNSIKH